MPSLAQADARAPRIVIVGSGLAGTRAAHALWTNHRIRLDDLRGGHQPRRGPMLEPARLLLRRPDRRARWRVHQLGPAARPGGSPAAWACRRRWSTVAICVKGQEIYWIDGGPYTAAEAQHDWATMGFEAFRSAAKAAPWPQLWDRSTKEGRRLDHLSVPEWLDESGIGATSRFGQLMLANAVSEYGGDPAEQSALDLIYLPYANPRSSLAPMAGYDEKYHIVGGNDQLDPADGRPAAHRHDPPGPRTGRRAAEQQRHPHPDLRPPRSHRRRRRRPGAPGAALHGTEAGRPSPVRPVAVEAQGDRHRSSRLQRQDPRRARAARRGPLWATAAGPSRSTTASARPGTTACRSGRAAVRRSCSASRGRRRSDAR